MKLSGPFSERSARVLIEFLKEKGGDGSLTFVDTRDLAPVDPAGEDAFFAGLRPLSDLRCRIVFTGPQADTLGAACYFRI